MTIKLLKYNLPKNTNISESLQECKLYLYLFEHCLCQNKFGTWEFIGFFLFATEYFLFPPLTLLWWKYTEDVLKRGRLVPLRSQQTKNTLKEPTVFHICLLSFCTSFICKYAFDFFQIEKIHDTVRHFKFLDCAFHGNFYIY